MVHLPFLRSSAEWSAQPIWQSVRWKDPTNNDNWRNSYMPAQIEARRGKIDCSRKQVTNDGPNWKQFVGPDEGVAYSSVYYLNMPIKHLLLATIKYFCWIRADPLLIFWGKERGLCDLNSCLRHLAEIEEVRSSSLMRVQICGVWPRAVMRETAEMAGPAAEKKIGRWQCKPRNYHDKLPMCWFDHAYAQTILEKYCFSSSYSQFLST